jgi:hypothetical protein
MTKVNSHRVKSATSLWIFNAVSNLSLKGNFKEVYELNRKGRVGIFFGVRNFTNNEG